jgi:hypothetical protein
MPRKAAKKEEPKKDPPEKMWFLKLPPSIVKGSGVSVMYEEARTQELGLTPEDGNFYGAFHGLVVSLEESKIQVQFVYPEGDEPTTSLIDLVHGVDETAQMAITEIKESPIPKAQLKKWLAKGLAAASSRSEEELEEAEETEDTETEYE